MTEIAARHPRKYQRPSGSSADDDFDDIIFEQWKLYLSELPIEVAVTKSLKSHYWKEWLQTIVIDIDESLDIDVSDAKGPGRHRARANGDADGGRLTDDSTESIVGSPPGADEDRRVGPALHDQQQQGGPTES